MKIIWKLAPTSKKSAGKFECVCVRACVYMSLCVHVCVCVCVSFSVHECECMSLSLCTWVNLSWGDPVRLMGRYTPRPNLCAFHTVCVWVCNNHQTDMFMHILWKRFTLMCLFNYDVYMCQSEHADLCWITAALWPPFIYLWTKFVLTLTLLNTHVCIMLHYYVSVTSVVWWQLF